MTLLDFSKRKSILILISFLVTFGLSRLVVFMINNNLGSPFFRYNIIGDYHIHHFTYGILILVFTGFISLFISQRMQRNWLFILYGIGIGLIFDEFGIWIKLDPQYNDFASVFAVFVVSYLLILSAFVEHSYRKFKTFKFLTSEELRILKDSAKRQNKKSLEKKIKPQISKKKI